MKKIKFVLATMQLPQYTKTAPGFGPLSNRILVERTVLALARVHVSIAFLSEHLIEEKSRVSGRQKHYTDALASFLCMATNQLKFSVW